MTELETEFWREEIKDIQSQGAPPTTRGKLMVAADKLIREQAAEIAALTSDRDALGTQIAFALSALRDCKRMFWPGGASGLSRIAPTEGDALLSRVIEAIAANPASILADHDAALVAPLKAAIAELDRIRESQASTIEKVCINSFQKGETIKEIDSTIAEKDAEILRLKKERDQCDKFWIDTGYEVRKMASHHPFKVDVLMETIARVSITRIKAEAERIADALEKERSTS